MKSLRTSLPAFLLVILGGAVGCGGGGVEGSYPVYPVSGTITYDGKPLDGATVIFYPADSTMQASHGMTDSNGRYKLTTFNQDDGAGAGSYKVTVKKIEGSGKSDGTDEEIDPSVGMKMTAKSLIPKEYGNMAKTKLKADVTKDGDNEFSFKIE